MSNRTTVKSNIITKNIPSVSNLILTDILNAELADNLKFREDVAKLQSSSISNITVDFTGFDRVDLTRTGGSLNVTFAGIGDGETKFLLVTKTTGQAVTFVGVTDITPIKANANALSIVLYEIVRKSSYYFTKAWVENVKSATDTIEGVLETATQIESNALSAVDKIVTPGRQPLATQTQKGIVELASTTEANQLTDLTKAITPGTIPKSSTSQEGVCEIATSAEVDAGTDTDATGDQLVVQPSEMKRKTDAIITRLSSLETLRIKAGGTYHYGNLPVGTTEITIPMGITMPYGYTIFYSIFDASYSQNIRSGVGVKGTTSFTLRLLEVVADNQDIYIDWVILGA